MRAKDNGDRVISQTYAYDALNRLQSTTDGESGIRLVSYSYDAAGNLLTDLRANGMTTTYTYNEANLPVKVENKDGGKTLSSYQYQYYLDGMQSQVSDNLGRVQKFTYDKAGRLSKEEDEASDKTFVCEYSYDVYGNRIGKTVDGVTTTYRYDANNRLTEERNDSTAQSYNYDNNGNLYSRLRSEYTPANEETGSVLLSESMADVEIFTFNALGQLVEYNGASSVSYSYGADGTRASKTVDGEGTHYVWNDGNIVYESNGSKYYYGNNLFASDLQGPDGKKYYLYDGHGSVAQLTNTSGVIVEDYRYDAFGNQLQSSDSVHNPFRYCGEYTDEETGFIYLRNRYYDPEIGRFISEDPAKDGLNWYAYCYNDPVNAVDPTGLAGESYYIVVFAGINTNKGSFDQVTPEIAKQILDKDPTAKVNYKTIYPYDDSISGDGWDDIKQVAKNAYNLSGNSVSDMSQQVKDNYNGEDFIHFVGYSGGGVAASRTAEQLEADGWKPYISSVIRVGSPNLHININWWGKRTTDIADFNDPLPGINIPCAVGWTSGWIKTKYIWGLKNDWWNPVDIHTSYFKSNVYDENNVSNLTKTVSKIIANFK